MNCLMNKLRYWSIRFATLDNITVVDKLYKGGLQAHRTIFFHDLEKQIANHKDKVLAE